MSRTRVAIDHCLSPKLAGALDAMYADQGFDFIHLKNIVGAHGDDVVWADVYKQFGGRVVLSGDHRIGTRPHEAVAFIDNGFLSFFPSGPWQQLQSPAKAATLIYWWPHIQKTISGYDAIASACWRIPVLCRGGVLRLQPDELQRMTIPDGILDKARQARSSRAGDV